VRVSVFKGVQEASVKIKSIQSKEKSLSPIWAAGVAFDHVTREIKAASYEAAFLIHR